MDRGSSELTEEKALNGTQITSVLSVIENVKSGMIDKEQAVSIIVNGIKLDEAQVRKMIG